MGRHVALPGGCLLLLMLTLALPAMPLRAQTDDPAAFVPADAKVFIELRDIAQLRRQWSDDPILQRLYEQLPAHKNPDAWQFVQAAMNMTGEQIFQTYFSRQIIVIAQSTDPGSPGVIFSRIESADATKVIDALTLTKCAQAGDFDVYQPEDGSSCFAFGGSWMAIADSWAEPFLLHVLNAMKDGPHLADDAEYQHFVAMLPAQRQATCYLRDKQGIHALALASHDDGFSISYAGSSRIFDAMRAGLGDVKVLDFGPAPHDAIFTASFNLYNPNPCHVDFVNRLIAPRTFQQDVLPSLGPPLVVWLSPIDPGDQMSPTAALGLAVHMSDEQVAHTLDQAFNNLVMVANFAGLQWGLPSFSPEARSYHDHPYFLAAVGEALVQRTGIEALRHLAMVYGRVGSWYVAASHEHTFQAALDHQSAVQVAPPPASEAMHPVARVRFNGQALSQLCSRWSQRLSASPTYNQRPQAVRSVEKLSRIADWLGHFQSIDLTVQTDNAGTVFGTLDVTRPE